MTPDCELLSRYRREHSEEAFAELVNRHLPLVYGVALRYINGDRILAQDVAQDVFMALAREISKLRSKLSLWGWLYKTTCFVACKAVRTEIRLKARAHDAAAFGSAVMSDVSVDWSEAQTLLDQSSETLNDTDREALLLRFGKESDFKSIAQILGLSGAAARKRVERALNRLRTLFEKRGVTTTEAALGSMLAGAVATSVPAGSAANVTQAAWRGGLTGFIGIGTASFMTLSKMKAIPTALSLLGLGAFSMIEHNATATWRQRVAILARGSLASLKISAL